MTLQILKLIFYAGLTPYCKLGKLLRGAHERDR